MLDKKRDIAINKKKKALLNDEVSIYRLEENTLISMAKYCLLSLLGGFLFIPDSLGVPFGI